MAFIYNVPGIVIFLLAGGMTFGIVTLFGIEKDGLAELILSPLTIIFDALLRASNAEPNWFHPLRGGHLFYIPVWICGLIWAGVGIVKLVL